MEPAGVGAADLKECLRLQLVRSVRPDAIALQIVDGFLESMARQQYSAIAKALHVPKAQVLRACDRIRALNPRPLNGLGGDVTTQYILPDFYVLEDNGQLRCILNDYFLPKIQIDPSYSELVKNKLLSPADSEYIQKQYGQAQEIVKFLSYRKSTLQRVVEYILVVQADFFHQGPAIAWPWATGKSPRRFPCTNRPSAALSAANSLNASGACSPSNPSLFTAPAPMPTALTTSYSACNSSSLPNQLALHIATSI